MTIEKKKKVSKALTKEEESRVNRILHEMSRTGVIMLPIITIRDPYIPETEDARVTWLKNFAENLGNYTGTINCITGPVVTAVNDDATFYDFVVKLAKTGSNFSEEATAYKDRATSGPAAPPMGAIPIYTPPVPVPVTIVLPGIFTRIGKLVELIKADGNYTDTIGQALDIIGAENTFNTDDLVPLLKGKIVDGKFPGLKLLKKGMEAFNLYADYHDGQGMHFIMKVTTFRRGFVDNHPLPTGVNSAIFDYQAKYVYKDQEVGHISATVSLTVTRSPV